MSTTLKIEERKRTLSDPLVNWLAGIMSGLGCAIVGHPFDTVKVRLQTQPTANPVYSGISDCLKQTWQKEGVGGFYRGIGSPIAGQVVLRAWQFTAYGEIKNALCGTQDPNKIPLPMFFVCGVGMGIAISPVECVIDFFKSQMQVQYIKEKSTPGYKSPYTNVLDCVIKVSKERGLRGWFQGYSATLARNSASAGLYIGGFECARYYLAEPGQDRTKLSNSRALLAGGLGGLAYWSFTFPLDCIKSAMQGDDINPANRRYASWSDCVRQLYAEGGIARFFRGYSPCVMRSLPANATLFTAYQVTANFLNTI